MNWACPEHGLAFPEPNPEQIRKHPENALRANSEFPGLVRLEIPKPWKIKHIPSPESFQNCATPSTVGTVSFFGGAPSMEQPELVMKLLTVLGALLNEKCRCWASQGAREGSCTLEKARGTVLKLPLHATCWQPTTQLQRRKTPQPQNRSKIPPRHPNSSTAGDRKNTPKIPRKYAENGNFVFFWYSGGVFEGVFRGVSFWYVGGYFWVSGLSYSVAGQWVLKQHGCAHPACMSGLWYRCRKARASEAPNWQQGPQENAIEHRESAAKPSHHNTPRI